MSRLIAIRVDGNSEIGFGHLVRTQALAQQLEKTGARVIFFSNDPQNIQHFKVIPLEKNAGETEDQVVEGLMRQLQTDMLIIDSYLYDQSRLDRMSKLNAATVYIDDLNQLIFNTDFVVNGNLYADRFDYKGSATFLLGPRYLMLREDFNNVPRHKVRSEVKEVLITLGAADTRDMTMPLINLLKDYKLFTQLRWHVVIGPAFRNYEDIKSLPENYSNIVVYTNPDIRRLMDRSDICISAAGSTIYELAACGVPAISIVMAENQVLLGKEAANQGFALNMGWYNKFTKTDIYQALDHLITSDRVRHDMCLAGQNVIDGHGTLRLIEVLLNGVV